LTALIFPLPRKYGERLTAGWIASLTEVRQQFTDYGKTQTIYYRSAIVLARFLKGKAVRMDWSQLEKEDGTRTQQCLLLSTDITLLRAPTTPEKKPVRGDEYLKSSKDDKHNDN